MRLRTAGGHAVFGMDDGYVVGPPLVVSAAIEDFIRGVEKEVGLICQWEKSKVLSWDGVLPAGAPEGFSLAEIMLGGTFLPGMLVYGVPVGVDLYFTTMLDSKVSEIEENAMKAVKLLGENKQALWTVLRSSIKHQFEYWLGLVHLSLTQAAANRMDSVVCKVMESLVGYHIPLENEGLKWEYVVEVPVDSLDGYTFPCWVTQLPVKMGGLGLRSQSVLAPVAYVACPIPSLVERGEYARPFLILLEKVKKDQVEGGSRSFHPELELVKN